MYPEFSTNRSMGTSTDHLLTPLERPLEEDLAKSLTCEVNHGSNEDYLKVFEQKDLSDSFRKYCVEGFVQRYLRRAGFLIVGDMLALNHTEFQLRISRENQTVQARSLTLYRALQSKRNEIVRRHSRAGKNRTSPPTLHASRNPLHEVVSNGVALSTASENSLRPSELGFEANDSVPVQPGKMKATIADPHELSNNSTTDTKQTPLERPPIQLGQVVQRDRFGTDRRAKYQELPYGEEGLRRHILIAGSTGSGKTVAARYIVEQAAIAGVPSIVIDAQGDISSLVIEPEQQTASLFEKTSFLQKPETGTEENDLKAKIGKHLNALSKHPGPISGLFAKRCLPRIFTPGRPDLGLPLSLPPYLDILAAYNDESNDELQQHELEELLSDEVENLVRTILPKLKAEKHKGYVELLVRLFRHANEKRINLDGRAGIRTLHELVQRAQELAPDLFRNYLSNKDQSELSRAVYGLQFSQERKWLEGQPLDIAALCRPGENSRAPINIINVQELHSIDDKKRVLRQVIAAVYKYGVQNPRHSGPPSLLLYIDEIGTGYMENAPLENRSRQRSTKCTECSIVSFVRPTSTASQLCWPAKHTLISTLISGDS